MRSLRKLLVLVSMVVVLSMLSMGVAFAHPSGAEHAFAANGLDNSTPVGSNASAAGLANGNFIGVFANNPLCPAHHPQHTH